MDYTSAGVDIEAGDRFSRYIASLRSPALSGGIGGFAGGLELDLTGIPDPVLLSTTDGVGTKLLVAERLGLFRTIGIDLVAMCVNDLAVCGAQPLQFLDYIACGKLTATPLEDIIEGIVRGCELADCSLSGGETAEMPDVYVAGSFDLAGFCTGVVSKARMLPRTDRLNDGDPVFGIASNGVHSNGLSLARKALEHAPEPLFASLLEPTRIYVRELMHLAQHPAVAAAAHITGGGLAGNVARVIPDRLSLELSWDWPVPEIFGHIAEYGSVEPSEMRTVFNMGIGVAIVVSESGADRFLEHAHSYASADGQGIGLRQIGVLRSASTG